jgi:hypothetical protein
MTQTHINQAKYARKRKWQKMAIVVAHFKLLILSSSHAINPQHKTQTKDI